MVDHVITNNGARWLGVDLAVVRDQAPISTVVHVVVNGLIHPADTIRVALEGIDERARQDQKWGESNHPDMPAGVKFPSAFYGIPTADAARKACEESFRRGVGSIAHIFVEEVAEAIEALSNPVYLRGELVQVMAVCGKWIEQIDRREGFGGNVGQVIGADELGAQEVQP
jgi:hypothetical protein